MTRKLLPTRRQGFRFDVAGAHVSTGSYPDGTLGEIFINYQKEGTFAKDILNALAMSISLGLQHGIPLSQYHHTFRNFNMDPDFVRGIFEQLEELYPQEQK